MLAAVCVDDLLRRGRRDSVERKLRRSTSREDPSCLLRLLLVTERKYVRLYTLEQHPVEYQG